MSVEDSISFKELLEKYQGLVTENSQLKEENRALKSQLGIAEARIPADEISGDEAAPELVAQRASANVLPPGISKNADEGKKIRLFMSALQGTGRCLR